MNEPTAITKPKALFLYQKEVSRNGYISASCVTRLHPEKWRDEALSLIRVGYKPYIVSFKHIPPHKLMVKACELAVRDGKAIQLPQLVES